MPANNKKEEQLPTEETMVLHILLVASTEMLQEVIGETIATNLPEVTIHFYESPNIAGIKEILNRGQGNLIFIDWNSGDSNQLEIIKELRAINTTIPLIMLANPIEENELLKAVEAGVTTYIEKPIRSQQLWGQIKEFIDL